MLQKSLMILAADPRNVGRLCELLGTMPNIESYTLGGEVCWDTLASYQGWRVQRNKFTTHYRLLDPNNIRKAWGSRTSMMCAFERLERAQSQTVDIQSDNETINKFQTLSKLFKDGHINQQEYEKKKAELLGQL